MGKSPRMGKESAGMGGEKLCAFFGSDIGKRHAHYLKRLHKEGYSFLPLDTPAIGMAASNELPYNLIDEWLGPDEMLQSRKTAAECELRWFESAREDFVSDGICWPEFDREAMYWFWHDITAAKALAEAFVRKGIRRLACYQAVGLRPALYYRPSDVISAFWKGRLQDRVEILPMGRTGKWTQSPQSLIFRFLERVDFLGRFRRDRRGAHPSLLAEKLVLVLHHGEFDRFTPVVRQLYRRYAGQVAGVILFLNRSKAEAIARHWPVPVASSPHVKTPDPDLREKFLNGYKRALDRAEGQVWEHFLAWTPFHFRFYCEKRWPLLASKFRCWTDLWRKARPKAVLVSSLEDSESQLPTVAARQLEIPTFSIPHGGFSPRSLGPPVADRLLYSTSIQKALYERAGTPPDRLLACRNLVAENEYPVGAANDVAVSEGWRVLALTNPIGTGCLAQRIFPAAQLRALRALANPPSDVAEKLRLRVKVHPGFPDLELFDSADVGLKEQVLPFDMEISAVLKAFDLVVAVNYCGSALIHVLRAGMGVVFFWTDVSIGKVEPYTHADLLTHAGPIVRDAKELWDCVIAFFTDKQYEGQLLRRASEYCSTYLDDSLCPDISEVLSGTLEGP